MRAGRISVLACRVPAEFLGQLSKTVVAQLSCLSTACTTRGSAHVWPTRLHHRLEAGRPESEIFNPLESE